MSKTWELAYQCAAYHHERAAYHAHGHTQHAIDCDAEAAKLHADHLLHVEHCESSVIVAYELGAKKKGIASELGAKKDSVA
jgi:hypothetical protein